MGVQGGCRDKIGKSLFCFGVFGVVRVCLWGFESVVGFGWG